MACDKNQTYLQVRSGIGRTSGGCSLSEFGKRPATRGASNPGLTEPASMFVIEPGRVSQLERQAWWPRHDMC
jgi:hypothetical protein